MNNLAITRPNICRKILSYLYPADVCNFEKTSKGCKRAVEDDRVWEEFIDTKTPSPYFNASLTAKDNFIQLPLSRVGKFFFLYGAIELLSEQFKDQTTKKSIEDLEYFQEKMSTESIKPYDVLKLCMYKLNNYVTITELILSQKLTITKAESLTEQQRACIEQLYSNIDIEYISIEKALTLDQGSINKLITVRDFINKKNLTIDEAFGLNESQIEKLICADSLIENNILTVYFAISLNIMDITDLLRQYDMLY